MFDRWQHVYNHERPHEALGMAVPASRYHPSPRPFPDALPPIVYDRVVAVRRVQDEDRISWQGRTYRVGRACTGLPVGLRPSETEDGIVTVCFMDQSIATRRAKRTCVTTVLLSTMSPNTW